MLARVEERTRVSVWNMQRLSQVSLTRIAWALDRRSRGRGVEERTIYPRPAAVLHPLLTTVEPSLRVAPVATSVLVSDGTFAMVLGTDPHTGQTATYGSDDPDVVALACAAFQEAWDRSSSWEEAGLRPPLQERRFRIAVLLIDGHSDREIADELGIGLRTVSAEVRAIVDWLGARNRGHAVAMLVGAG
ncbi:helix-turn-helix transcriptional regulator [Phycicoccus avicenniae]|uniref:helix-turn-helix transcriptional regulator n=1 Tax=Phycicoccus avicenniae TaxID=2828860 RepID=UPI003D2BC40A